MGMRWLVIVATITLLVACGGNGGASPTVTPNATATQPGATEQVTAATSTSPAIASHVATETIEQPATATSAATAASSSPQAAATPANDPRLLKVLYQLSDLPAGWTVAPDTSNSGGGTFCDAPSAG